MVIAILALPEELFASCVPAVTSLPGRLVSAMLDSRKSADIAARMTRKIGPFSPTPLNPLCPWLSSNRIPSEDGRERDSTEKHRPIRICSVAKRPSQQSNHA